jgi:uncharacterized YigZ family protein
MNGDYIIPAKEARAEIIIEKSRFIASAGPVFSVEKARDFIQHIKKEFSDASHHVPAYLVGSGSSVISHSSDAGEPSGTAGRPILAVLQGSGLGDVAVVVTRYFGGRKLGTGGLVHAYSSAVKEVLAILPRARKAQTLVVLINSPYPFYERIRLLIDQEEGKALTTEFGENVIITLSLEKQKFEAFQTALTDLTRGKIHAEIVGSQMDSIVPLLD